MNKYIRYGLHIMLWIVIISWVMCGCKSAKESQADKDYVASIAHEKLLEEVRAKYPCDTSTVVITKVDTSIIVRSDTTYSHDTAFITKVNTVSSNVHTTVTVVDSAYGQLWNDRYNQAGYLLQICKEQSDKIATDNTVKDLQIQSLKPWKLRAVSTWIIISIGMAGFLYLKLKP